MKDIWLNWLYGEGHSMYPFTRNNHILTCLRNILLALCEWSTQFAWGTFGETVSIWTLLRDILLVLFKGQSGWPYWETFYLSFLRDNQVDLIERHSTCQVYHIYHSTCLLLMGQDHIECHPTCPFWGTVRLTISRVILLALFEGHSICPFWGTTRLTLLIDILFVFLWDS